jgi:voltage-gated potassium channel
MSAIGLPDTGSPQRLVRVSALEMLDRLLGPLFFFLSVAFLILTAGVIHRLGHGGLTTLEAEVLFWGLLLVWPVFVAEALLRLMAARRPESSLWQRLAAFLTVCLIPALRLGGRAYADPAKIWLPKLGWTTVDHHLRTRLERFISIPMIVIALMVLPFLAMEYFWLPQVRANFALSLVLDIGTSAIWLAFALEFIVMVSVADDKTRYCLHNFMNLAVVFLPLVDFLPLLRLARLARVLEAQQLGKLGRLYRLRGLIARIWRAVLLLEMIQRLFGGYRERRLKRLKQLLIAREEELADLRQEIAELESKLAGQKLVRSEWSVIFRPMGASK